MKGNKLLKIMSFLIIVFSVVLIPNNVFAEDLDCEYLSDTYSVKIEISINDGFFGLFSNASFNSEIYKYNTTEWWGPHDKYSALMNASDIRDIAKENKKCPEYIFIQDCSKNKSTQIEADSPDYEIYAFYDLATANQAMDGSTCEFSRYENGTYNSSPLSKSPMIKKGNNSAQKQEIKPDKKINSCKKILGSSVVDLLQMLFDYIKVLGPILVLVFSSIDFTKTILNSDQDGMKKAQKKLAVRLICAALIYFLPLIVTLIINLILGGSGNQICGIN